MKLPFAAGFSRSQCGTKSFSKLFQARFVEPEKREMGFRALAYVPRPLVGAGYRPRLALIAVFPLPNRSYAAPKRGLMSLTSPGASWAGNMMGTGMNRSGPTCCRG